MPDNKTDTKKTPQFINFLLIIICFTLTIFGFYQVFTSRIEDGLPNIIIGLSLSSIPFGSNFNYKKAPNWQKLLLVLLSILVILGSFYLIYVGFIKQ